MSKLFGVGKSMERRLSLLRTCQFDEDRVVNVFIVELRELEPLAAVPDVLAVVGEDLALKSLGDALLDEEIHRFSAPRCHHERFSAFCQEVIYRLDQRAS